jgi:hypothetical protein
LRNANRTQGPLASRSCPKTAAEGEAREDARREGKSYSFEDVRLISEVVSTFSARKDYDDRTAKYGRYGIPVYLVVDPYAQEVVLHTQPTAPVTSRHIHTSTTRASFQSPWPTAAPSLSTSTNRRAPEPEEDAR